PGNIASARSGSIRLCPGASSSGSFLQPLVTYQENELIQAEAYSTAANPSGNDGTALTHLNNARAVPGLSALAGITGVALLDSIMTEKYVALFQNIETWNDYRRTCIPALAPFRAVGLNPTSRGETPGPL